MRLCLVFAVVVAFAPFAKAHKSYCGHSVKVWQVWSYGQPVDYKEQFNEDYTYDSGGVHWHARDTYWRDVTSGFDPWHFIHRHYQSCPTHSPA